jgi:hypothetical protein
MSPPRGDSLSVCLERASTSDFSTSAIRPFRSLTGFERKGDFAADNGSVVLGGDLEHGSAAAATLCSGSVDVASPI